MASYVISQAVRFGTNLILTRLLYPEAFGLMAIIFTIQMGINLLSDVGISAGIVVNEHGSNPVYMNTAWTVQIIRGLLIGLVIFIGAPYLAGAMHNSDLEPLLRIVSFSAMISGFNSTKTALADRTINASRRVQAEIAILFLVTLVTIGLSAWLRNVNALAWSLVAGSAITATVNHYHLHGPANKLAWHKPAIREIISFGGLTLLSSGLTYIVNDGARLFSATLIDAHMMGIITLAGGLSVIAWQAIQQISGRVLMPMYAEVNRDGDKVRLKKVVSRARLYQIVPSWLFCVFLILFADNLFSLIYDHRYAEGANILKIQCLGMLVAFLSLSYNGVLWGLRKLGANLYLQAAQGVLIWACMYAGFQWHGATGLVIGAAASSWLMYPITALFFQKLGLYDPLLDLGVIVLSGLVLFLTFDKIVL